MERQIEEYLNRMDFDVRKTKEARFMDQKVTPDVLCIIADSVLNYIAGRDIEFSKDDIWDDEYFNTNVKIIFNKPDANNDTVKQEYDKFTSQPLRMLAYAGVLSLRRDGRRNLYKVENALILEFIGLKERNAFIFLYYYITKVLADSGLLRHFNLFKDKCENDSIDNDSFNDLKTRFQRFIIGNTPINGTVEVNRIFPKILNVYSCWNNIQGTEKGRLANHPSYYTDLMYNRPNWRDADKNKGVSRQESVAGYESLMIDQNPAYSNYQVQKAISKIKKMYRESEIKDQFGNGEATQVHHIFPKSDFPHIAHYLENLIKLTPTQHFTKAHPSNKTQQTNKDYQLVCLLAKSKSIEQSLKQGQLIYRKESFIFVINSGLSVQLDSDLSFENITRELARIYNAA